MARKKIIAVVIVILGVVGLGLYLINKTPVQKSIESSFGLGLRQVEFISKIDSPEISLKNEDELNKFLVVAGLWIEQGVYASGNIEKKVTAKSITVEVKQTIDDPSFVQNGSDGKVIIASKFWISEDGEVKIEIAPGEYVLTLDSTAVTKWLDDEFWRVIRPVIPSTRNREHFGIFTVKKKGK